MNQSVQFGMNKFSVPKTIAVIRKPDTALWMNQSHARRERLLGSGLGVNGQEVTPQHQRQQLVAKVQSAQRRQLLAMFSGLTAQRKSLNDLFNNVDPATGKNTFDQIKEAIGNENELRKRMAAMIAIATATQLRSIQDAVNQRGPRPVLKKASGYDSSSSSPSR
jgi:hypothetical protein